MEAQNTTILIREARSEDDAALVQYLNIVGGESDNLTFGGGEFNASVEAERKYIDSFASRDNAWIMLAERSGEIISCAIMEGGMRMRNRHAASFAVSVLGKYNSLGIGTAVTQRLIEIARNSGVIRKINLTVRCDNAPALTVYKKCGFIIEGTDRRGLLINDRFVELYYMGLDI